MQRWIAAILGVFNAANGLAMLFAGSIWWNSVPGVPVACRIRLTRAARTLGGSAACSPGALRLPSRLICVCLGHRTLRAGSAPRVRPFAAVRSDYYGLG